MCQVLDAPVIRTARLTLRAPTTGDAPRIAGLCGDFEIPRMTTRMPWPYKLDDAVGFVSRAAAQDRARENTFLIEDAVEGVVGCVGLFMTERLPEIGYWVGRPYWGKGIATEASRAALAWSKSSWGKRAIVAGHFVDNPVSGTVLCKAGFLYTGEVAIRHSQARGEDTPTRMMVWLA